ncbi:hypothetical protein M0P28_04770 [Streptococcus pasteurianus]|nr:MULTISPECIES: hypothetical protein [Streptococcus]MCO7183760.1 hypothetical protein [Streptococcus gallolyticus]MDV5118344.1 hypothetical protein [Streptococcus pasteurianus]MDV5156189.1 hypothetical protein [Streptococcus pasteurianus]MDV5165045.1 hypothetical protein [Streptococcus pasteurianus]WCQ73315.1 hypothetical protein M0P28_04770 [Streptococcus pasteurianus]
MKTALRIMAAGIGSRFGTGIKQLEPVRPCLQQRRSSRLLHCHQCK